MNNNDLNPEDILVDHSSEDDLLEIPLTKKVFYFFAGFVALFVSVIFIKFLLVGVGDSDIYTKSALANMTRTDIERAPRGIIKDDFGKPLLENNQAFRVFLSPSNLPEDNKKREQSLRKISSVLDISYKELETTVKEHDWRLGRPILKRNISHDELVNISAEEIPGLDIEPGFKRIHNPSFVFSHILGYTGLVTKSDIEENPELSFENEIGKDGLEIQYDSLLRGQNGHKISYVNAEGEIKDEKINKAVPGSDLKTFIDKEFQEFTYNRLKRQLDNIGSESGAVLAINPQNGEVISMVSIPSFNNNNIENYFNEPSQPLFNRITSGLYNPGSTIKPLVGIAALEEGVVTPSDRFYSTGELVVENPYDKDNPSVFKDWKKHGSVNLRSAIAKSSNVYFYIAGGGHEAEADYGLYSDKSGLGVTKLKKWWEKFGLDQKTQIDIPGEEKGFLPSPEWKQEQVNDIWRLGDTYNVSIGQGNLRVTPAGLLNYISAIANGGKLHKLRIAKQSEPEVISDLSDDISKSNLEEVQAGMIDTVEKYYGTAHTLSSLPMTSAGKTGSAEVGTKSVNAFFVGYAPAENPEIALLVLIENSTEGSLNAVPVAKDLFGWYHQNRLSN